MAVNTVNAQGIDMTMAVGQTAAVKQSAGSASPSFGEVLNKASDKVADKNQAVARDSEQNKLEAHPQSEKAKAPKDDLEQAKDVEETLESPDVEEETANVFEEKMEAADTVQEPDKMTTEQIADALAQMIEQLKDLLGVSDEELLAGMQDIGMEQVDLLNPENMAQLLTAIAGEGDAISFVTNEDLYMALQKMTAAAEDVSSQLMQDMGLSQEEFDALLEQFVQVEDAANEEPVQSAEFNEGLQMADAVNKDAVLLQEEVPTVIVEENSKSQQIKESKDQPCADQYEELPENQQETPVQETAKVPSRKPEGDAHGQEETRDFNGQHGAVQNFGDKPNEIVQVSAEAVTSYTSENADSILKQLADFVKIVRNENLTEMELQLHPASLGTVNVSLVTKGGAVTAEFTTQNEAVRAAIESQVSQLITNLEEQGVKVEAVEVSVASHEMERNLEENSQNDQSRQEQEEKQRIQGTSRRNSINFNAFADGDEMVEEMQGADDATRIAMELMAANGNSMDLMA